MVERYLIWLSEEKKKTWTYKNPTTTVPRERKWFWCWRQRNTHHFFFRFPYQTPLCLHQSSSLL
jgi:hypothetical protein